MTGTGVHNQRNPHLGELESWEAVRIADDILERHDGWEALYDHDIFGVECDPRDAFIAAWDAVKEPLRCDPPPVQALPLVERWPLDSERWNSPRDQPYRRLIGLCFWYALLLENGGQFFLSCRKAGELSGFCHRTASDYLQRARREGLVKRTQEGSLIRKKSAEYRFLFEEVEFRHIGDGDLLSPRRQWTSDRMDDGEPHG